MPDVLKFELMPNNKWLIKNSVTGEEVMGVESVRVETGSPDCVRATVVFKIDEGFLTCESN